MPQPPLFPLGWFVESLATPNQVLFIFRTAGNPLRSQPSPPLAVTVLLGVSFGLLLSFIPLTAPPGFRPLAGLYSFFLASMSSTSFLLLEVAKRWLMSRSFAVP